MVTDTIKDAIDSLWVDYCEASRPTDVSDDGIELYNIEGMNDAAYALYSAMTKLMSDNAILRTEKHADAEAIGALRDALSAMLDLQDNASPFGGEIYRDRVDRVFDQCREDLKGADQ